MHNLLILQRSSDIYISQQTESRAIPSVNIDSLSTEYSLVNAIQFSNSLFRLVERNTCFEIALGWMPQRLTNNKANLRDLIAATGLVILLKLD